MDALFGAWNCEAGCRSDPMGAVMACAMTHIQDKYLYCVFNQL